MLSGHNKSKPGTVVHFNNSHCAMGNCMENESVVPVNNPTFDPKTINHTIDVYFYPLSPPSRAALMLIKALGIKHNVKIVNIMAGEQMTPEFLKMNPMHTVPTINDGGFILWDSHVIMKYLVEQYAKDDSLYPKDPKKGAIVNQRLHFNTTTLFPKLLDYCVPVLFNNEEPDPNKATKFEELLNILDGFLKNQSWVAGDNLTIADFAIITVVATAEGVGFKISNYPNVFAWYQRAKNAMSTYGYEEINQAGANGFGSVFKSKLK
ncbi:Glutathione S-transferase 1-1-like Protein [Tribolium castaneum]|uniref:Glutathione S-transferase 1-1-like Protein n=2 Tax=Tribolium castaneum TaxID=7070 RepID=A0A139WIY7_TRICA|nr:Glutathione S-transferase 1-1-like Protein [Tribolium castaneum]